MPCSEVLLGVSLFNALVCKFVDYILLDHLADYCVITFFSWKVERVVGMVEGAVLVVDAGEGPLAQTKFVLAKALKYGLRPILLLNKVDRPAGLTFCRFWFFLCLFLFFKLSS